MKESRRDFLKRGPKRVALAIAVTETLLTSSCKEADPYIERARNDDSLIETGIQGVLLGGALSIFHSATKYLGIPTGNAGLVEMFNVIRPGKIGLAQQDINYAYYLGTSYILGSSILPVMEEIALRKWPSDKFLTNKEGIHWEIGVPVALAFASLHNLEPFRIFRGGFPLILNSVPIEQFIGGLFYWRKFREKGLMHSSVMHGADNASLPFWILLRAFLSRLATPHHP